MCPPEKAENFSFKQFGCLVTIYSREVFAVSPSAFTYATSCILPNNPALSLRAATHSEAQRNYMASQDL